MYENESSENVAVGGEGDLLGDVSSGGSDVAVSGADVSSDGIGSVYVSGGDVSANAGSEQFGAAVSAGDGVSDLEHSDADPDSPLCSCSCGDVSVGIDKLETQADKISGLVLLIFLFLLLEWTEKKLTAIVRNMSSRRRG